MQRERVEALKYQAVPLAATLIGGITAANWPLAPKVRSGVQHLAAGVVFAVVATELLPEVKRAHEPFPMIVSFSAAVTVMLGLRRMVAHAESSQPRHGGLPWTMLIGVGVDIFLDGVLLGLGIAIGAKTGTLLALALEHRAVFARLGDEHFRNEHDERQTTIRAGDDIRIGPRLCNRRRCRHGWTRRMSSHVLDTGLAFGCAALLYVVTEELLVEAHKVEETSLTAAMFFIGFLAMFLLDMVRSDV